MSSSPQTPVKVSCCDDAVDTGASCCGSDSCGGGRSREEETLPTISGKDEVVCCGDCKKEVYEEEEAVEKEVCKKEEVSCCNPEEACEKETIDNNDDPDHICICCVEVLLNEPGPQDSSLSSVHTLQTKEAIATTVPTTSITVTNGIATAQLETYANNLRACCKVLEKYCVRRSCCVVSRPAGQRSNSTEHPVSVSSPRLSRAQSGDAEKMASSSLPDVIRREKLQLELRGMDCADCSPKVERALRQLPSVTPISIEYFSGMAELLYDPETIVPAAICNYVARATGFGVKVSTEAKAAQAGIVTLPFSFPTLPPLEAFESFDTRVGSNPHIIEVSFPVDGHSPKRPRDVVEEFKARGATLVSAESDGHHDRATRDLIDASVRAVACALLSIPVLVLAWANLPHQSVIYGGVSLTFTTLIQMFAFPIFSKAIRSIVYLRKVDTNVLVTTSTMAAYVFSVVSYAFEVVGRPIFKPFWETSALLVTLILLGRVVASATRLSTRSTLRELERLQTPSVLLLSGEKALPQQLDVRLLFYGDIVRIHPDSRIVTDGVVVGGSSDVDEASITGENSSVPKWKGSRVMAGTLNLGGTLDVQVTKLVHENSLSRIMSLVEQAQSSRSPVQDLADRLSAVVLPIAVTSAFIAFLVWTLVGHYARHLSVGSSSIEALTYAIAVLVVSCPCAIGLAIPTVVATSLRLAMREGVLFRSAEALQTAHDVDVIAFDKTGTLTQGSFTVKEAKILAKGAERIISDLVENNKHPVSQGIHRYLATQLSFQVQKHRSAVTDIDSLPGKGIKASIRGFPLLGGSATFTNTCSHPLALPMLSSGLTIFAVTIGGQPIAFFSLADTPRPGAKALVVELIRRGKQVIILSGDTPSSVNYLANAIGIPAENAYASQDPEDKDTMIAALQARGKRVLFVGDGTNDAPGLSRANIALAVSAGSEVARDTAGALLLNSDLRNGVLTLLDIAKIARVHAFWSLGWCFLYNVAAILFASGAFVKVRIEPRWAGLGEVVSVLPAVAIGLGIQLRWVWRRRSGMGGPEH